MLRLSFLATLIAVAAAMTLQAPGMFSIKAKEAAGKGRGLPGCDRDTFIRYEFDPRETFEFIRGTECCERLNHSATSASSSLAVKTPAQSPPGRRDFGLRVRFKRAALCAGALTARPLALVV